jgi:hypothetical protein
MNQNIPAVVNANNLFYGIPATLDDRREKPLIVNFQDRFSLKVANENSARRFFDGMLRVRVFALNWNEDFPSPMHTTVSGCQIYWTSLMDLKVEGGSVTFNKYFDEGWMRISAAGDNVEKGRYIFVLEHNGPVEDKFRIMKGDAKQYFSSGFRVDVNSGGIDKEILIDRVKVAYNTAMRKYKSEMWKISDAQGQPCNTFRPLMAVADGIDFASSEFIACDKPGAEEISSL